METKVLYVGFSMIGDPDATGQTLYSFFSKVNNISIFQLCLDYDSNRHSNAFKVCYLSKARSLYCWLKKLYRSDSLKSATSSEIFQDSNRIKGTPIVALARAILDVLPKRLAANDRDEIVKFQPDVIYTLGENISTLKIVLHYSKKFNVPIVIHVMDNLDDSVYSYWKITSPFRRYYHKLLDQLYQRASSNLAISPKMAKEYSRRHKCHFSFAMNCIDKIHYQPSSLLSEKLHMVFSGGLHGGRDKILCKIGRTIQQSDFLRERIDLTVYTSLESHRNNILLSDCGVVVKQYVSRDDYFKNLSSFDILVHVESFEVDKITYFAYSMSTKIPEYLSVGRPIFVVGPREICSVEYLESTHAAYLAASLDDIENVLFEIANDKTGMIKKGKNAVIFAEKDFKSEITAQRVEKILIESVSNWQQRKNVD